MTKRTFKFRCLDCKAEQFRNTIEFSRAARPRCEACGSTWIEPVTEEARARILTGQSELQELNERRVEHGGGPVYLSGGRI